MKISAHTPLGIPWVPVNNPWYNMTHNWETIFWKALARYLGFQCWVAFLGLPMQRLSYGTTNRVKSGYITAVVTSVTTSRMSKDIVSYLWNRMASASLLRASAEVQNAYGNLPYASNCGFFGRLPTHSRKSIRILHTHKSEKEMRTNSQWKKGKNIQWLN